MVNRRIFLALSFLAIGILFLGWKNFRSDLGVSVESNSVSGRTDFETPQSRDRVLASVSPSEASGSSFDQTPAQSPTAAVDSILLFMKNGPDVTAKAEMRKSASLAAKDFAGSLSQIGERLKVVDVSDVGQRLALLGAVVEIADVVKNSNSGKLNEFLEAYQPILDSELSRDSRTETHAFDGRSEEDRHELVHMGPFQITDGRFYVMNLQVQASALYVVGFLQTPNSSAELKSISKNSAYSSEVRQTASQIDNSNLFVSNVKGQ
jgi:hypothetical protein